MIGENEVAIEVKATTHATPRNLKGLKAFAQEYEVKHKILITTEEQPRLVDGIMIYSWKIFLEKLWAGEII